MKKFDITILIFILSLNVANSKNIIAAPLIIKSELALATFCFDLYCYGVASIKERGMEIFKDIPGYEGLYQASDQGRIKSLERVVVDVRNIRILKERILKLGIRNGYPCTALYKNGKCLLFSVHRLILLTFEGQSNLQTNHKNCIKTDNRLSNLEYVTAKENMRHGREKGRMENMLNSRKKKVDQLDLDGTLIKRFDSIMDAERQLKIWNSSISACCLGRYKTAGGYKWRHR